ncbi:universal stress protein [Persicimonas caeni]|uniref:Universal stress protein n=1 Tax=Persicimonas caeni TaxID=2292766 RepID=A0A4Y6PZW0_PERCE|nr:universal stress protein [Persicimonas caeni]QDG53285.1 universal stress protein [Persicimonas caeni]QED34507.1 universal stress protein [Persicimonas caeni]
MKGSSIVLATDLSDNAKCAAEWTHSFAEKHGLNVVATHVVTISVSHWAKGAYDVLEDATLMEKARKHVSDWYEEATGAQPDEVKVLVGHAAVQLSDTVDEYDASMLVTSASGKGSLKKIFLGSVAQSLANDPPCPLVVVKPQHSKLEDPSTIVVGVDFSENSAKALSFAARLAKTANGQLKVVHADTAPSIAVVDEEDLPKEYVQDGHYEWAKEEMEAMLADHQDELEGLDSETVVIQDYPTRGMLDYVTKEDPDLIVVGRSGHSPFVSSVMGSVLLKVLQSAPATTIVVPTDSDEG